MNTKSIYIATILINIGFIAVEVFKIIFPDHYGDQGEFIYRVLFVLLFAIVSIYLFVKLKEEDEDDDDDDIWKPQS